MTDTTESLRAVLDAYHRISPPRGDIALGAGPTFRCDCGKVSRLLLNGWVDAADKLATSATIALARLEAAERDAADWETTCRRVNLPEYIQVAGERLRQDEKFGRHRSLADESWLRICIEELGEASKEIENSDPVAIRKEVVQAAAVLVAWLECNRAALAREEKP